MRKLVTFSSSLMLCVIFINAQSVAINTTGLAADPSSMLDVAATNKGILVPRVALTWTTSNAPIGAGVATSLIVYNTANVNDVTAGFYYWNGASWTRFSTGGAGDVDFFEVGTAVAPNAITDNLYTQGHVAIATTDPGTHTMMVAEVTTPALKLGHTGSFNVTEAGRFIFDEYADNYLNVGTYCGMEFHYDGATGSDLLYLNAGCTAVNPVVVFARNTRRTGFRTAAPTADLSVNGTADKVGGGTWAVFSDSRLKENIVDYTEGLDLILNVRPVSYNYNDKLDKIWGVNESIKGRRYQGVIAQELQLIAPDMVSEVSLDQSAGPEQADYDPNYKKPEDTNYLEVDPNKFIYALINSVQQQQKMILDMERRLDQQQAIIEDLRLKLTD